MILLPSITIPAKGFVRMAGPYDRPGSPEKIRFYCNLNDVPSDLLLWMKPNPREQNLESPVATAIAASMRQDHKEFHLRNRGILLSAKSISYDDKSGAVTLVMEDPILHGNIDGGHTLRLILAAEKPLPEQYVEFEVITGLTSVVDTAEARNTSVALDIRSMEEMKGSYDLLKHVLGDASIDGNYFFNRVELKMNQQREVSNAIDIRTLISILLMFNQDLYPCKVAPCSLFHSHPKEMYGGREAALKKYLELGGGNPAARNDILTKMAPIFLDILTLWDTIQREMPLINEKRYKQLKFAVKKAPPHALFSDVELPYFVPQGLLFPVVAAFRCLVKIEEDGTYGWELDPLSTWAAEKSHLFDTVLNELKTFMGNANVVAKSNMLWDCLYSQVQIVKLKNVLNR